MDGYSDGVRVRVRVIVRVWVRDITNVSQRYDDLMYGDELSRWLSVSVIN